MNTVLAQLGQGWAGVFELLSQSFEFAKAGGLPGSRDILGFTIQPEGVLGKGTTASRCCVSPQVGLGEGYGERGVGGEIEFCVAFPPVPI